MSVADHFDTLEEVLACPNQDAPMHTRAGCTFCSQTGPALDALNEIRRVLTAHHQVGVMDSALVGDVCPICRT